MVLLSSRLSLLIVITQCQGNLLRSLRPTTVKVSEIHFAISSLPNSIPRGYENTSINRSTKVNALHKFKTHARYRLCLDHTSHCFLSTLDFLSSHSALAFPQTFCHISPSSCHCVVKILEYRLRRAWCERSIERLPQSYVGLSSYSDLDTHAHPSSSCCTASFRSLQWSRPSRLPALAIMVDAALDVGPAAMLDRVS